MFRINRPINCPIYSPISRRALPILLALLLALPALAPERAAAQEKRPITEQDLYDFVWIADPRMSPDGRQVVFVRVAVNEDRDGYDGALWIVPADGSAPARPFTRGPRDGSPRWSPDGSRLVFTRSLEEDGVEEDGEDQAAQLYLISMVGGEAVRLTDLPEGAGSPAWAPDGRTIAFASTTNEDDLARQAREKARKEKKRDGGKNEEEEDEEEEEPESDVQVITRAIYRYDGGGYLDFERPSHLWAVAVPAPGAAVSDAPEPRQLTRGPFAEDEPAFSPDGRHVYFTSNRDLEPYYALPDMDVYRVPAAGGEIERVASIDGPIDAFALSPDGRRIAFTGNRNPETPRSYNQTDLFVAPAEPGAVAKNLTAEYDFDVGGGLVGDQHAPGGGRPRPVVWSADGRSIATVTTERGRANLRRFDAEAGAAAPLTSGDQEVASYTAGADGSRFALVISTPTVIGDLHALDPAAGAAGAPNPIFQPNRELFTKLDLTEPEEIEYESFDGRKVHAWVQRPPGFDPAKKYPLILQIHGGPHAAHGYVFFHEVQWMAAKGYVVIYPNPRGSSSYGQELGNVIQYDFPGDDAKDLLAGVDAMLATGSIDPERLAVTGGSGGGILTNWIVTQTGRFAAAAAQRSIADWADFWLTADFTLFQPTWFRAAPWQDPEDFARRSPITYVEKVTTPLMLIEGEDDLRTPPAAGGEQMFRALKYLKKPTVMVRFPGETHDLSRSGQPRHRIERLRHIVGWFDHWLLGEKKAEYEVR